MSETAESRATHLFRLWIDNEEGPHNYWRNVAEPLLADPPREAWTPDCIDDRTLARHRLADLMKGEYQEGTPDLEPGPYSDLLGYALALVDWDDIAETYIDLAENS